MSLKYAAFHDFPKEEVLDDVVVDGDGPAFNAETYDKLTIQVKATGITLGADIILKKSLDGGVSFIPIAQIDKIVVALGDKTHEFSIFDEPLARYIVNISARADGTYRGTARGSK